MKVFLYIPMRMQREPAFRPAPLSGKLCRTDPTGSRPGLCVLA